MAKSGWPVTGQIEVNSGQVKRATYSPARMRIGHPVEPGFIRGCGNIGALAELQIAVVDHAGIAP